MNIAGIRKESPGTGFAISQISTTPQKSLKNDEIRSQFRAP